MSNEIKIKITEILEDNRKQAHKLTKEVGEAGGFSGQHGQIRKNNVEASLAGIDAIFEKGNLSLSDIKELNKFFKELYESLGKAAANTSQMSKELTDLIDQQVKTIDKLNEKRQQQIDLLSEGKFDKNSKKFIATKESTNVLRNIGAFRETQSGDPSKRAEVNLANIMKNMEAGIKYFDKDGKDLSENPAFKEQIEKVNNLNKQHESLSKSIARYEKALEEATKKIEDQTNKDQKNIGSGSLPSKIVQAQIATNSNLNNLETQAAQAENTKNYSSEEVAFNPIPQLKEQPNALKKAFKQFSIYTLFVNNARKALNSAVTTIRELDRYLTEQAMVTGKTRKEVFSLVKTYQNLATQYNATTKEVAEVNTEFMRQGKSMKESIQLTEAALASARVAGISGAESVNYLTTALNGFQLAAEDAMKVSDKFAAVAAASATSYEEIAVALSKVASQANTAGMSIDYTTALLSKGIETTKEAPETIGTALKTVIARMRELGDYGETLSGDTDINNVETQLAYVGIELKNANGELRSTEDVLDELGRKWDTLSNNQQAAVAKALAGTRQQSRLIAMMSDYERVIELQTIAQRSQGSTLAQMQSLMTGLDASLNKIAIAWEGIISNLVDNDILINLVNGFGSILKVVEKISDSWVGQIGFYTILIGFATSWLGNMIENNRQKQITLAIQQQEAALQTQENLMLQEQKVLEAEITLEILERNKELGLATEQQVEQAKRQLDIERGKYSVFESQAMQQAKSLVWSQKILGNNSTLSKILSKIIPGYSTISTILSTINARKIISKGLDILAEKHSKKQVALKTLEQAGLSKEAALKVLNTMLTKGQANAEKEITRELGTQVTEEGAHALAQTINNVLTAKELKDEKKITDEKGDQIKAEAVQMGEKVVNNLLDKSSVQTNEAKTDEIKNQNKELGAQIGLKTVLKALEGPTGWATIAIVAGVAATIAAVVGAIALFKHFHKTTEERIERINELAAENYKLNEQTSAIKSAVSQYEKLNNQVIKTKENQEEMNKLLDEAGEKLDEEQKKYYETLGTEGKLNYLKKIEEENNKKMEENYKEQLDNMLKDKKTLEDANVQASLQSMNNYYIGNVIDDLTTLTEEDKLALEGFTQNMVAHMDNDTLLRWASDTGRQAITSFVNQIKDIKFDTSEGEDSIFNILNSEDYGWADQVKAYKQALGQLSGETRAAFEDMYKGQYEFLDTLGEKTLEYFDELALTGEEINALYDSYNTIRNADATKNLSLSEEQYKGRITNVLQSMTEEGKTLGDAVEEVFADQLSQFEKGTKEYNEMVDTFVKTIGKTIEIGSLNMGQNIEKFGNRISSVYEKATQWNSLSESEKTQFLNDNQDLFKGEQGAALAKAFENGNYEMIKNALMSSDILNKEYEKLQAEIDRELSYQMSLSEDSRDYAYVQYLKDQKEFYAQKDKLFKISIEEEKKQQDAQLDAYKDYLQKQQDALTESLEKQKEAYEKYFDQINEIAEDEDYEEKAELLVSNISKLSGSNATTEAKRADLEKQLEDLEKERLQQLRERAQEQIISNIEDEIEAISDKFDKLLDSNQALLLALTGEVNNPEEFVAKMISTEIKNGADTALDIQSFLNDLQSNFGMLTSGYDFSKLDIKEDENKNLILNVNGTTYNLTQTEEKNLFEVIMTALTQIGKF